MSFRKDASTLMPFSIDALRNLPLDIFNNAAPIENWRRSRVASIDDNALIALCAEAIAIPKRDRGGSSFVLHAPLELLARARLLRRVMPEAREIVRRRIAEIVVRYANAGEEMRFTAINFSNEKVASVALVRAMDEGDQTIAHSAMRYLLNCNSLNELRALLIDKIAPLLGAAGHAPILLAEWNRDIEYPREAAQLILAPLHYLLNTPQAQLHWIDTMSWHEASKSHESTDARAHALTVALARPQAIDVGSHSIAPQLIAADNSSHIVAALREPLMRLPLTKIEKILLRTAAQSMLQDDVEQAAYGWTHCLTIPLALIANGDVSENPRRLYAIAATYVYAFRAATARVAINVEFEPESDEHHAPRRAAAKAFRASVQERPALRTQLASSAAAHRDAHLAKYTLACFDAAERDPAFEQIYLAAAAYLGAWWQQRDEARVHVTHSASAKLSA